MLKFYRAILIKCKYLEGEINDQSEISASRFMLLDLWVKVNRTGNFIAYKRIIFNCSCLISYNNA